MPEDTGTKTDTARRIGRYASGIVGLGAGCVACAFITPAVYAGASTANAKATDATTPDGTPFKDQSVTAADKFGGGLAATVVAYFLISHITVASVAVGGVLTDCIIGVGEGCFEAGKSACQTAAKKCASASACLKQAFCCPKKAGGAQTDVRMDPPAMPNAADKV